MRDVMRGMLGVLGSAVVTLAYALSVVLLAPVARLTRPLMPYWGRAVLWCFGVRLEVHHSLPQRVSGTIWAVSHTSLLDTFAYPAFLPSSTVYIGKAELSRVPLLALSYRILGHLFVDRRGGRADMERFFALTATVPVERPIFIHPEGTRTYAAVIAPLHRGCARIARHTGRVVVPIASKGGEMLWPPGQRWPARGVLHIAVGAPMTLRPDEDEKTFGGRVRAAMQSLVDELPDSALGSPSAAARHT